MKPKWKTAWFVLKFRIKYNMKSAFELAMERLEKESPTQELTNEQKVKLSELSKIYEAKIADKEVFLNGEIAKAEEAGEFEQIDQLTKQLASERKFLDEELEQKKNEVRGA